VSNERLIRNYFTAWQNRDWDFVESKLADGFTFTSPYDDHIGKDEYKEKCWDAVKDIEDFEIVTLIEEGDEAFIRYQNRINGERVQNTEHFAFEDGRIKAVTVFFGRPAGDE
jgi:ketosteroid isomerase-like protein